MSPDRHPVGRGAAPRLAGFGRRLADWRRGLPPVAVDAMLVVACYLTIVIDALLDDRLEWWVVALAALNTMPLLWRRRYPLLVAMMAWPGRHARAGVGGRRRAELRARPGRCRLPRRGQLALTVRRAPAAGD
jgi:hypothetical protein